MPYGFFDGENALPPARGLDWTTSSRTTCCPAVETVSGPCSYDTQFGGNKTVPLLKVNEIEIITKQGRIAVHCQAVFDRRNRALRTRAGCNAPPMRSMCRR